MEPFACYLVNFGARGNRPGSVRSYAYDLLRWWRWLLALAVLSSVVGEALDGVAAGAGVALAVSGSEVVVVDELMSEFL